MQPQGSSAWARAGGFGLLAAVCLMWIGLSLSFVNGLRSLGWPQAEAVVEQSELTRTVDGDVRARADHIELRIRYRFTVDDTEYTGTRLRYGHHRPTSDEVRTFAERFPEGEQIAVRYNPRRPSQSVLAPGISKRTLIMHGMAGMFFSVFPVFGALLCFRYASRRRHHPCNHR